MGLVTQFLNIEDEVTGIIEIWKLIIGLPTELQNLLLAAMYVVLYPWLFMIAYFVNGINFLWMIIASLINVIIGVPNVIIALFSLVIPSSFPDGLLTLIYIQLVLQVLIRSVAWLVWLYKKIPLIGGH